jgi:hypothetical protein
VPLPVRTCRSCETEFILRPNKPGNINDCPNCSVETAPKTVAKVAYPSKNSSLVEIEITQDVKAARLFNNAQRRNCAGPLTSILSNTEQGLQIGGYTQKFK